MKLLIFSHLRLIKIMSLWRLRFDVYRVDSKYIEGFIIKRKYVIS